MKNSIKYGFIIINLILMFFLCIISNFAFAKNATPEINTNNAYIKKTSIKINSINPDFDTNPLGAYYPGFRGHNQLIIYTPEFGEYTNTNEFGKEAVVINDKVFCFCGSDCYIPKNGFIISGHGTAKKWINENIQEGANIKIRSDIMMLESIITPESYLYKAGQRINKAKKVIFEYKQILPGYQCRISENYLKHALKKYNEAKYKLGKFQYKETEELADKSLKTAETAFHYAVPAVRNELHGIWLRPVEKNEKEIIKTLKRLKKTGIDNVFLETYYHGYTIFPSKTMAAYGLNVQRPEFKGRDPLKIWTEEAHKRDMKIHVWFQTFYIGKDSINTTPKHMLKIYPEWANVQKKNADKKRPMPSISEHNGYFLDPANPNVQKFLFTLLNEIVSEYRIDGLNIDYIRYPKSLSSSILGYLNSTWGYSDYARKEFDILYGKDPYELEKNDPLIEKWNIYRQSKVTNFVSQLRNIVGNRNITISTVIFPGHRETAATKMQNWAVWGQNNYVDAFTPLIMSSDTYTAGNYVKEIRTLAGDNICILPGLFEPFTSGTPFDLLAQIVSVRKKGSSGIIIFDNAHLSDEFKEALSARIFRKD